LKNAAYVAIFITLILLVSTASAACTSGKCTCTCKACQTDSCNCKNCVDGCPLTKCLYGASASSGATCSLTAKKASSCTPSFTFLKSGKTVQLKDTTKGAKYWRWHFNNDGKIDSYKQNPKAAFPKSGSYKVCLTASCGGTSGWIKTCKVVTV
jgi:hypothetical protein